MQQTPKLQRQWHGQGFFLAMGLVAGIILSIFLISSPLHNGIALAVGIVLGIALELVVYFNKRQAQR
jgi:hypothetical protein